MNREFAIENLGALAAHAELEAARLEADPSNPQISAAEVLRQRAERYREAQIELMEEQMQPYPFEHVLSRPSRMLVWTIRCIVALVVVLVIAVVML